MGDVPPLAVLVALTCLAIVGVWAADPACAAALALVWLTRRARA
jgi:hypothetical protein